MAERTYRNRKHEDGDAQLDVRGDEADEKGARNLKRKDYESSLRKLHVKLVELQEWVRHEGKKICIVFEGRDGAGKGGTIKAITARVSPRIFVWWPFLPPRSGRNRRCTFSDICRNCRLGARS